MVRKRQSHIPKRKSFIPLPIWFDVLFRMSPDLHANQWLEDVTC